LQRAAGPYRRAISGHYRNAVFIDSWDIRSSA
jgi:hypothetical protein